MEVQQAEGGWHWQTRLETGFCPHHPSLAWLAPSMWFGIVWKQARFLAHISFWGWKEMRHLCGIFWLGRLEGCREVWGTCAIYVGIPSLILANEWDLRHLCPPKAAWCWGKIVGANQRRRLQKLGHFWTYMARTTCLKMELRHLSPVFCLWQRWRNSIFRAMCSQYRVDR